MSSPIPANLRVAVILRANSCCEYCGKPRVTFLPHEVDHVIAEKHGGSTTLGNLAYACFECNRHKGSDIASLDPQTGALTGLFHPRTQRWQEHFRYDNGLIIPLTEVGRVTVFLLQINDPSRIQQRLALNVRLPQ